VEVGIGAAVMEVWGTDRGMGKSRAGVSDAVSWVGDMALAPGRTPSGWRGLPPPPPRGAGEGNQVRRCLSASKP
jgi:hypothetical protein